MSDLRRRPEGLVRLLPALTVFLCLIQPVLDVTAYWLREFSLPNAWMSILRLVLLLGGFALGFLVTEHKRFYLCFSLVILAFLTGHVLACLGTAEGYLNWSEDLTDQARTLVLPMTALTVLSFLRANRRVLPALLSAMACDLLLILLVQLVSTLTGTDPHTYPTKAVGIRGWFIWPSPQSAILSLLCPVVIAWAPEREREGFRLVLAASLVSFGMLFVYGTRLGYLTIAGVGLGLAICVFPGGKRRHIQAGCILTAALLFLALYPLSPMARNRAAVEENEAIKAQRVSAAVRAAAPALAGAERTEEEEPLAAAYRYNLQGMIDRFGLERVAKQYGYTLNAGRICDDRLMKKNFCLLLTEELSAQSPLTRFFGAELERTRVHDTEVYDFYADDWKTDTENYDPENDVIGVLTLNGLVGLCLLLAFLLAFGLRALWAVWQDRSRFTPLFAAFLGAYGIALIYAFSTASTLRRNNASVYFAWILAVLWYLSCRKPEKERSND